MTAPLPYRAVVFDLDGTLIDSAPDLHAALNKILGERGRRELELLEATLMIGDGARNLVLRAFTATGEPPVDDDELTALTERFLEIYEYGATAFTVPYPGVEETLQVMLDRGAALGVCTNKPHRATVKILEELGMDRYFAKVVGGDSIPGVRKPDPRTLHETISGLGGEAADAVMVGDNANDVGAARNAGVPVILIEGGYTGTPASELGADMVVARFSDLPDAMALLRG